jgi:GT2 family glycosyltransferase
MAINRGIKEYSVPEDFIVKMDNDVTVNKLRWPDILKTCIEENPQIGILGLKRKDLPNSPGSKEYPTILEKTNSGMVEWCDDIIGTATMFGPKLLEKVGYLWQPGWYGYDDVLMCCRSITCGFKNAFYPSIEIEHLDDGKNPYTEWKRRYAGLYISQISGIIEDYQTGKRSVYYNPF